MKSKLKPQKDDIVFVSLLFCVILLTAIVESWMVLGEFFKRGYTYYPHLLFIWFVTFNALGNLWLCHFVDNSVVNSTAWKSHQISEEPDDWRFCEECQIIAPPRSWHCKVCEKCILKRDHHCILTGRCVGHNNYRYFFIMLVYGVIGSAHGLYLYYLYMMHINSEAYSGILSKLCFINPAFIMFKFSWNDDGIHYAWPHLFIPFLHILIMLNISSCALLYGHGKKCLIGATYYEGQTTRYNMGSIGKNLKMILGKHYLLVWLSPFTRSELPHNGVSWEPTNVEVCGM